jgi:hypothetical protein
MTVRWASTLDFGEATSVVLLAGNAGGISSILSLDPSTSGEGYGGERIVDLGTLGLSGPYYFRAEVLTDGGDDAFRAYSNPIWVTFDDTSIADGGEEVGGLGMKLARNPFVCEVAVELSMPAGGAVKLEVYDVTGRRVRTLVDGRVEAGSRVVDWNGRDEGGCEVGGGVYFLRLESKEGVAVEKGVLLR